VGIGRAFFLKLQQGKLAANEARAFLARRGFTRRDLHDRQLGKRRASYPLFPPAFSLSAGSSRRFAASSTFPARLFGKNTWSASVMEVGHAVFYAYG
jgi:hypothetical protein